MTDHQDLKINRLEIMMEQNEVDHKEIKSLVQKIDTKLDSMTSQFANKWVEKAMVWIFASAGVVFIGLLVRWIVLIEIK